MLKESRAWHFFYNPIIKTGYSKADLEYPVSF